MPDGHSQRVTVRLVTNYQFTAEFPDADGTQPIVFDEPPPLGDGHGQNAAAVLSAAIGNCLSATLVNCLSRAHVEVDALTAKIVTHISRNEQGRYRVVGIDVELAPSLPSSGGSGLARCERIFENYCTVTESVRQGIPVKVSIRKPKADPAIAIER